MYSCDIYIAAMHNYAYAIYLVVLRVRHMHNDLLPSDVW
jgi:hypothetical protein